MYVVLAKNAVEYFKSPNSLRYVPTYINVFNTMREAEDYCQKYKTVEYVICKVVAESTLLTPMIKHHV